MKTPTMVPMLATAGALLFGGVPQAGSAAPPPASKSLREAIARNEIVPLKSIMDWIEEHYLGQVVEVELENESGYFGYEVDLLSPAGSKIEFRFDARSGELLSVTGKDLDKAKRK